MKKQRVSAKKLPVETPPVHSGNPFLPLLVIALIVESFFTGALYTKVQYLEKNGAGQQVAGAETQGAKTAPTPMPQLVKVDLGHFPPKGDQSAKVAVVEFADFRCPYCEQFFTNTESQFLSDYVNSGKITFSFRQFPFLGPASTVAANAAECANDQGKFWDFHDFLYKNQPSETDTSMYATDILTKDAGAVGVNEDQFRSCLDSKQDANKATRDMNDGQKAGVGGTPTFYILQASDPTVDVANIHAQLASNPQQSIFNLPNGNVMIIGAQPYSVFQSAIDQLLKKS